LNFTHDVGGCREPLELLAEDLLHVLAIEEDGHAIRAKHPRLRSRKDDPYTTCGPKPTWIRDVA
jgi:hypothetical protein